MEFNKVCQKNMSRVATWLKGLDDTERKMIINNYSEKAKDIYYIFNINDYVDVLNKILSIKNSTDALINCFASGDPVVDHPGYRLDEFLKNEMVCRSR